LNVEFEERNPASIKILNSQEQQTPENCLLPSPPPKVDCLLLTESCKLHSTIKKSVWSKEQASSFQYSKTRSNHLASLACGVIPGMIDEDVSFGTLEVRCQPNLWNNVY